MPELPEVQTVVSDIHKSLVGYRINKVEIKSGYKVLPKKDYFLEGLEGTVIEGAQRVAKNIVINLNNKKYLTFHLAMTGRVLLRKEGTREEPHQKVQLTLSKGTKRFLLRFSDMRMFGKVSLLDQKGLNSLLAKYGPDLYREEISVEVFIRRVQTKNTSIKNALLEQSIVNGLGNIYVTDALWLAGIHPETKTKHITTKRAEALLKSAKEILSEGVLHRGSTLPDQAYVDLFGKPGEHQNYFRVYGKTVCPKCHTKVEYKKVNGRGTYFCPVCQK